MQLVLRLTSACAVILGLSVLPGMAQPTTTRVSVASNGDEISLPKTASVSLSRNGRYAVFASDASNLVTNDTDGATDVFARDMQTGVVTCLSAANSSDAPVGGISGAISDDGRYAVFLSSNLSVTGAPPASGVASLFLRDLTNNTTIAIAKDTSGRLARVGDPFSISADGNVTAFQTSARMMTGQTDQNLSIYTYNRSSASIRRITSYNNSMAAEFFLCPTLTANGAFLTFVTGNSTLVPNDTGNLDMFRVTLDSLEITRVSVADDGSQANGNSCSNNHNAPSASDDGRYVVFASSATNLVPGITVKHTAIYLRDIVEGHTYFLIESPDPEIQSCANPSISSDGRYVAFEAYPSRIPAGETYLGSYVCLLDRTTSQIRCVSMSLGGEKKYGESTWISGVGTSVAFLALAPDLTSGDDNHTSDAYVADVSSGQITRVSAGPGQKETGGGSSWAPWISSDGRYVFFHAGSTSLTAPGQSGTGLFRHDRLTGETCWITANSFGGASADGRYVAVSGRKPSSGTDDDLNIYLWVTDIVAGTSEIVSVAADGTAQGVNAYGQMGISRDGKHVLFSPSVPIGSSLQTGLFERNIQTGVTTRVSEAQDGTPVQNPYTDTPVMSADGRFVAFHSWRQTSSADIITYVTAVAIKDMQTGVLTEAAVVSEQPSVNVTAPHQYSLIDRLGMSADGRYVVFSSNRNTLVPGDTNGLLYSYFTGTDVFVYDRTTAAISRASAATDGTQANDICCLPTISDDGRFVAFVSPATNLVPNHSNSLADVYVHDMQTGETKLISVRPDLAAANGWSGANAYTLPGTNIGTGGASVSDGHNPPSNAEVSSGWTASGSGVVRSGVAISGNGQWIAFLSRAADLVSGDTNDSVDVFVRGPLLPSTGITMTTVAKALRVSAGLDSADGLDLGALGLSSGKVGMGDVVALCKQMDTPVWSL